MLDGAVLTRERRVNLSIEEIALIAGVLRATLAPLPQAQTLAARLEKMVEEENDASLCHMRQAYRDAVELREGDLEMDQDAEVSLGDDPGAYVMVWKWVSDEDAGILHVEPEEVDMERRNV